MQFLSVLTCSTLYNVETGRWQWPIKAKSLQSRLISQWYYTHKNKRGRNTDEYTGWLRKTSKEKRFELGIELWAGVSQVCGRGKEEREITEQHHSGLSIEKTKWDMKRT